jgi:uncharacterized protein (TIGR00369 family)
MKLKLEDDQSCFVCGMNNPDGLQIRWEIQGQTTIAHFIPTKKYQGWKGIVHGGVLATLLDEAMARLAGVLWQGAVTAEMTVRYLVPAVVGEKLIIKGEVVKESKRLVEMRASLCKEGGEEVAKATAKVIKVSVF